MNRPSKLLHPGTAFIQSLQYNEVAYKDMTPAQRYAIFEFMLCDGDGVWAEHVPSVDLAIIKFGDVRFGVGKFANDDTMKIAFVESTDGADTDNPLEWFAKNCTCPEEDSIGAIPVILNRPENAPEFGLFEWGYEFFYNHWTRQPETEFVCFLPNWNPCDDTGRGGQ